MAVFVATNAYCMINSVDLSAYVKKAVLSQRGSAVDVSAMNSAGDRAFLPGLKSFTLTVQFNHDYASSKVHATLKGLINTSTTFNVRAVNTTIGATNPEYQGSAILLDYDPVNVDLENPSVIEVTFQGTGALTEDTTP